MRWTYDVYLMIGLMLGPVVEAQLSRALSISNGDASVFFTRPAAIVLLSLAALAIVAPRVPRVLRVVRGEAAGERLVLGDADAD